MRCLLIIPPWNIFKYYSGRVDHPNGILYIGAVLQEAGHDVKFLDGAFYNSEDIINIAINYRPDFIGIHSKPFLRKSALELIKKLKEHIKDASIVVGGPGPTYFKEKYLDWSKHLDCVVFGEGELTTKEFISRLEKNENLRGVDGCCFRTKKNKIIVNNTRAPIENLDSLPHPARNLLEFEKYRYPFSRFKRKPSIGVIASRGCNHKCSFCFSPTPLRFRSPKNVVDEIEECVNKYGVKDVRFWDESFFINEERVDSICQEIFNRNLDITWQCNARVNEVNKKLIQTAKKAGCWGILYGVESGIQKNLDNLQKNISLFQIKKAIKISREVGINTQASFILGIPGETFNEGLKTLKFAFALGSDYDIFSYFTPFPGSESYENYKNSDLLISTPKTMQEISLLTSAMTKNQLKRLMHLTKILHKLNLYFKKPFSSLKYHLERTNDLKDFIDISKLYSFNINFKKK